MPNSKDKSLDRVREQTAVLLSDLTYPEKLDFRTLRDGRVLNGLVDLFDSELLNLREELAREVEGLRRKKNLNAYSEPEREYFNDGIDKVLAIIRSKDVQE